MTVSTIELQLSVTHTAVNSGAKLNLTDLSGVRKLIVGAIEETIISMVTTGIGKEKVTRDIQGLQDLSNVTLSALARFTAANDIARAMHAIFLSRTAGRFEWLYETGVSVEADFLVTQVGFPTDVGDFVMANAQLESRGDWDFTGF